MPEMTPSAELAADSPIPLVDERGTAPSTFYPKRAFSNVWRREALLICAALVAQLIWDATGLDFWISSKIAGINAAQGFPLRHVWLTEAFLHRGGKIFYGAVFLLLAYNFFFPFTSVLKRDRRGQIWWFITMLLCIAAISVLKYLSKSSCPWDLMSFGGTAQYLSHWDFVLSDGGPGRCFPSGHVSGAFALFAISFAVRPVSAKLANQVLIAVLVIGGILGAGQVLRGAHFVSHVTYSAWICWLICFASDQLRGKFSPSALS